jgi:hypothetical protein
MDQHCDTRSYDETRDWRTDARTDADPDDTDETLQPAQPALTRPPKVAPK